MAVIPVNNDGEIIIVRQHRLPAGRRSPLAGMKRAGEEDEECARRELLEETVYRARVLRMAWSFHPVPVLHRENNVVSRKGLEKAEQRLNEDEAIEVVEIPVGGALEMLRNGLAEDAKTIKGYAGWLRNRPGCWERLGTNTHIFQH